MINLSLFSLRPEFGILPNPYPRLHKLKVGIEIVSPLAYLSLTHEHHALLLLQEVILPIIGCILSQLLKALVHLVGDGTDCILFEV